MKTSFSAYWSEALGEAIKCACAKDENKPYYQMDLVSDDAKAVIDAVNQGIDAHLDACNVPSRGDKYRVYGNRMACEISAESLPVLVRRLMESGNENALLLASAICETLGIELI